MQYAVRVLKYLDNIYESMYIHVGGLCATYRRPGFNCIVKQLRFWLSKVIANLKIAICAYCVLTTPA